MDNYTMQMHIECSALVQSFAQSVDARRYDDVLSIFADDGVFERPGSFFRGREEIHSFLKSRPTDIETRHVCMAPLLSDVREASASGVSYFLVFQGPVDADGIARFDSPAGVFEYHDKFALTAKGWRIVHRVAKIAMLSSGGAVAVKPMKS